MSVFCANCGQQNADGAAFCDNCGTGLATGCPNCGSENRPEAKFCRSCGTALVGSAPGPIASPVSPSPQLATAPVPGTADGATADQTEHRRIIRG